MSSVIDFLERMGQDARLRRASPGEVELALDGEHLEPRAREAILSGDQSALGELLGRDTLCCMLIPAEEEDGEKEREDESIPSREDEESSARTSLSVAV